MTKAIHIHGRQWTRGQAVILSGVCLAAGIGGGWSIPRFHSGSPNASTSPAFSAPATGAGVAVSATSQPGAVPTPDPNRLKAMADTQAAPLLEKLKADPQNADLLISIGNLYYDAQQYPAAVGYYARALQSRPSDVSVRTDMGTAYWYMGDADRAVKEFDQALTYAPDNPNTLFNLGIVKWKSGTDVPGAVAAWKKLLATNPNYEAKAKVEQMLAEAGGQASARPGETAK